MNGTWTSPDPRTIAVHCGWLLAPLGSLALAALATGGDLDLRAWITIGAIAATFAVLTVAGLIRLRRTEFRLTGETFELRTGLFTRTSRSVPLTRIRGVDLTASPAHRLFGLTTLRIGTGGERGELRVDALARRDAEALRAELARHTQPAGEPVLSTLDTRWLRFAPLTVWGVGGVFLVLGTVYRVFHDVGIELWQVGVVRDAFTAFGASALWLTVPALLLAVVLLGSLGALGLYLENWWRFRLEWADSGTLGVRRGLFTTRSVSIERRRLRGIELREPLLLRAGGGATVKAVAGGLGNEEETRRRSALLPPAPKAEALRVVTGVLGGPVFDRDWLPHPRVARRRRVWRGLGFVVVPGTLVLAALGVLFTPVLLHCAWIYAVLTTPAVLWLASDAYRHLGHAVDDEHVFLRSGVFSRNSVALRRDGVVAWTFSSTPFSRRAGVETLTAGVAAGEQGYSLPDFDAQRSAAFADHVTPGLLTEFLSRR